MKIGIACDHGGFVLKETVKQAALAAGAEVLDLGTDSPDVSVDYPDYAAVAIGKMKDGTVDRIILICGTGIGMSIAANRVSGVRGTLCQDSYTARMSREHNNSNCLILGGRVIGPAMAEEVVRVWCNTAFAGSRHAHRLEKVEALAKAD